MAPSATPRASLFSRSDLIVVLGGAGTILAAGIARYAGAASVLAFILAGVAVGMLAALVGRSVEQLGDRFGAGATGVLQSALGNLPELFIAYFSLRAGLLEVVQFAIVGSILANLLLVLGAAFLVGGLKHGVQRFDSSRARNTVILLMLATAALVLPSLAAQTHSPAASHEQELSVIVAVVLLAIFALSLPASLRRSGAADTDRAHPVDAPRWPTWLAVAMLGAAGAAAALVADWFVYALQPAIKTLHISPAFAGLVIVAIAGNAIENVVGIQLAARNQSDYALSVIVSSPLQIALVLAPALVLLSFTTGTVLTLAFAPMVIAAVVLAVVVTALIVFDGESNWLEGATLIALYVIIATVFWWG